MTDCLEEKVMLENKQGQHVPDVVFKTLVKGNFVDVSSDDLFKGKTVVVFSLPGAFTPTCSSTHLPRYNELVDVFIENGVDEIICISVNDAFVMDAWKENQEAGNITLIPDGNGDFSRGMGMLVDKSAIGFGERSWRYSMLVKDGVIEKMFIEPDVPGDPFEVSDADTMLDYINVNADKPDVVSILTRPGCAFCARAKQLLSDQNIDYDEISLGTHTATRAVRAITGMQTVPQVFINGEHIGGAEDLEEYFISANEKQVA